MNIATALKQEISRIARKEIRSEVQPLKKASSQYRTDIAALKRRVADLERLVAKLSKGSPKKGPVVTPTEATSVVRFSAKGFAAQRKRLGLSAAEAGMLLGCSGLFWAVGLQVGKGHDPPESQSDASHCCAQEDGQERSGCKVGPASGVIWVWPSFRMNLI